MHLDNNDPNKSFFLYCLKNIVKTGAEYTLQNVFEEDDICDIYETKESMEYSNKNAYEKKCEICSHRNGNDCLIRKKIEKREDSIMIPYWWVHHCEAYDPIERLNIICNIDEMAAFICRTEHVFNCPEEYELYYGFQRKWDEGTGYILETTREYYNRGGVFEKIPDKYPCVIYADFLDNRDIHSVNRKLQWIYIGENTKSLAVFERKNDRTLK